MRGLSPLLLLFSTLPAWAQSVTLSVPVTVFLRGDSVFEAQAHGVPLPDAAVDALSKAKFPSQKGPLTVMVPSPKPSKNIEARSGSPARSR
ncbi:MAG: hypothetical protein WDO18_11580 [Acidobacteriota bacterium]